MRPFPRPGQALERPPGRHYRSRGYHRGRLDDGTAGVINTSTARQELSSTSMATGSMSDRPLGPLRWLRTSIPISRVVSSPGLDTAPPWRTGTARGGTIPRCESQHIKRSHLSADWASGAPALTWTENCSATGPATGNWPQDLDKLRRNPWAKPDWMLLSW